MKAEAAQCRSAGTRGLARLFQWVAAVISLAMVAGVRGGETGAVAQVDAEILRAECAALQKQVEFLSRALAGARVELDSVTAALARRELESGNVNPDEGEAVTQAVADGVRLVDVNRELRMVVVGAGKREGIAAGMVFSVMHEDRAVARVRVVDVRRAVAGAVIERREFGAFPEKGDRVLLDSAGQ